MFKLPSQLPTIEDDIEALTDYLEIECFKHGEVSLLKKIGELLLTNDEIAIDGIEDETDNANQKIEEITQEIERRQADSSQKYPFLIGKNGYVLAIQNNNNINYWVYLYLLLSTRLNMKNDNNQNSIDGTQLLENLSATVAKNYFGSRSESWVFGTATKGGFQEKVNILCQKIGEGGQFRNKENAPAHQQDDKLDVVVWTDFGDRKWSKFIAFGQCKTGTSFEDKATIELQPMSFCKKWFDIMPVMEPAKMFFCSRNYPLDKYSKVDNAGIVFDRLRIMDCLPDEIDAKLCNQIQDWCNGALTFLSSE